MPFQKTITACVALAMACTAGILTATPASAAAGSCSVRIGPNLAVDAPYEEFNAVLAGDCATANTEYASWDVVHARTGFSNILIFDGTSRTYMDFYSWEDLGSYKIRPSFAYDTDGDDVAQNTVAVLVKAQSQLGFSATRNGSIVTLNATGRYYNVGVDAYQPWKKVSVAFQSRTSPTAPWKTIRTVTASDSGKVSYGVRQTNRTEFRAVLNPTTKIWGRSSAAVAR